jgi:hypothetical protein
VGYVATMPTNTCPHRWTNLNEMGGTPQQVCLLCGAGRNHPPHKYVAKAVRIPDVTGDAPTVFECRECGRDREDPVHKS